MCLLWLVGWLVLGAFLLSAAVTRFGAGGSETPQTASVLPAPLAEPAGELSDAADEFSQEAASEPARQVMPIEEITLGRRVKAHNPLLGDAALDVPELTAATHRAASFRLPKPDGSVVEADLLVPVEWLLEIGARIGGTVELDLEEQGASGPAEVLSIAPCPDIRFGEGAIVTGVFRHTAAEVLNLYVEGDDEPLGVTPNHPIWSADRQDFIPAGDLRIGENLRTSNGRFLVVTSITSRGPPEPVYNIQVHGEHVYYVGSSSVLVHNTSAMRPLDWARPQDIRYTQPTASQYFSDGRTINDSIHKLNKTPTSLSEIPTIRVFERNGQLYSLDNRRLVVFRNANVDKIPIIRVDPSDPAIAAEIRKKFNPIRDGEMIVIIPASRYRRWAEQILRDYGLIR